MSIVNGRVPTALLARSAVGVSLTRSAAKSADRLANEFREEMGYSLTATDGYRPLAVQERIFLDRYRRQATGPGPFGDVRYYKGARYVRTKGAAAAIPGTSNHGVGRAIDFASGVNTSFTSTAYLWMARNAGKHGWSNVEGRAVNEPWHWTHRAGDDRMRVRPLAILPRMNKTAYKRWQKQLGQIDDDGIFGAGSAARLRARLNAKNGHGGFKLSGKPLSGTGPMTARDWMAAQQLINVWAKRGDISLKRPLKVTGKLDARTAMALRKTINANLWE